MNTTAEKIENKAGYKKTELGWIPDEWKILQLGDLGEFKNGINKDKKDFGFGTPMIGLMDIFGKNSIVKGDFGLVNASTNDLKEYSLKKDDILFIRSSVKPSGVGLTAIILEDLKETTYSGFLIRFRENQKYLNTEFKKHCFYEDNFRVRLLKKSTISANTNINQGALKSLTLIIPTLHEQQKIAEILSCWDKSIEKTESLITKKTQLKKVLMQKLLTGKLRFGEFADKKWKKCKLGDIFERIIRKNTEKNTNTLTISAQQGLINQEEFYKKRIASNDTSNYLLIKKGEFAYNKSYSTGYPMGAIKKLDRYESGVVSSLYICFALKSDDMYSSFFAHYFEAGMLNQEIQNIAQEGARNHGLLNIGITEFFNTLLKIPPSLEEQQKIAAVLNSCDKEIELLNKQLDALKEQKKGLMQKLLTGQIRVKV